MGYLERKGDENPRISAQWLLAEACGLSRIELYTRLDQPLSMDERDVLRGYVTRRGQGEPLQYITGEVGFSHISVQEMCIRDSIMPGAVYQDHGARVDPIVGGRGGLDRGGANNLICPEACGSRNTASEATNGFLVNVEKVDVAALAALHPDEFGRAYDPADGLRVSAWMVEDE